jgi:hypothetical protein
VVYRFDRTTGVCPIKVIIIYLESRSNTATLSYSIDEAR